MIYCPSEDPIINKDILNCPRCNQVLVYTSRQKLLAPPLKVMKCDKCKLEYWRRTE